MLVQAEGWPQIAANLALFLLVAPAAEITYGTAAWLAAWFAGGLLGNLTGYLWYPFGAGASVGICGLIGLACLLRPGIRGILVTGVGLAAALVALDLSGPLAAAIAASLAAALAMRAPRLAPPAILLAATALTLIADNHGPAIIAGALAALTFRRQSDE